MIRRLVCCSLLLALAACIDLGGTSPPTRYYLLRAQAESPARIGRVESPPLRLQIAPVTLAPFLDRTPLVSRQQSRLALAGNALWGEPLGDGVARVVGEDLERLRPGLQSSNAPWSSNGERLELYLDVRRFDGLPGAPAWMEVRWTLKQTASGQLRGSGTFSRELPPAVDYEALVEGYDKGLLELSRQIADRLK